MHCLSGGDRRTTLSSVLLSSVSQPFATRRSRGREATLKFKGYDYQFVGGDRGHHDKRGGALLPESLR
jgi:hypothetical protein